MGCCGSSAFDIACRNREFKRNLRQFETMQMPKHVVRKLFYAFKEFDMDGSGSIGLGELLTHLDLPRSKFTEKIFSIFDDDRSGEIEFKEFVLSVWNYCTLTKVNLDKFAFDLYDADCSGELSAGEILQLIQDIFGKNEMKNSKHAKSILAELEYFESQRHVFNMDMFHRFMKNHQVLLFPAFQMQLALQTRILGTKFWEKNAQRRLQMTNGEYVSVGKFILSSAENDYEEYQQQGGGGRQGGGDDRPNKESRKKGKKASKSKTAKQEAEELYAQNFLTTPDEQPAMPSFSESAKLRWAASVQAAANLMTTKKGKRFTSNSKVTPEPSPRTSSSSSNLNNNKILSAVGFHSHTPSPAQSRQNSGVQGIHASNSYNTLANLAPLPTTLPMYTTLPMINKSDSNVSATSSNRGNNQELLLELFDAVPTRTNNRRGSKDYSNALSSSPDKDTALPLFGTSTKPSHVQRKKSTTSVKYLIDGGSATGSATGYDLTPQESPMQSVKNNRRKSFGDSNFEDNAAAAQSRKNVRRGSFGLGAPEDDAASGRQKKERRGSFGAAALADGDAVSGRQKKERRGSFVVGAPAASPDTRNKQGAQRRGSFNADSGAGVNISAINTAVNIAAMQLAAEGGNKQRRKSMG